jgi:hypothetical protein
MFERLRAAFMEVYGARYSPDANDVVRVLFVRAARS